MGAEKLLIDLAAVWVDRWLKYGGGLVVDADADTIQISMRESGWRLGGLQPWQRHWKDGWQIGRWRELSELCGAVPGLRAAIIHHVVLHGEKRLSGSRVMYADPARQKSPA